MNLFNESCPLKEFEIKTKRLQNPWYDKTILKRSRKKQRLYNKFLKNRTTKNEKNYKNFKNEYNRLLFEK